MIFHVLRPACIAWAGLLAAAAGAQEAPEFTSIFGEPLGVEEPIAGETFTEAVETFHRTGENPYAGDEAAAAEGRAAYARWCQACHMPDGTGRMGPSLVDGAHVHARVATDQGFFEVVYGGAAGAMQAFGDRIPQDQILMIMAYVESLKAE